MRKWDRWDCFEEMEREREEREPGEGHRYPTCGRPTRRLVSYKSNNMRKSREITTYCEKKVFEKYQINKIQVFFTWCKTQ